MVNTPSHSLKDFESIRKEDVLVSIILCSRNENEYIEKSVKSLLQQTDLPGNIEILIVDGLSTDGTREKLQLLAETNPNIKIIDNEKMITPAALNLGIQNSQGRFICIMSAHAMYSNDYIRQCLELMKKYPDASCVGGPIVSEGKNKFGQGAALAMSHILGVGNAWHRFPAYEGEAEMACFPMFKREVFNEIGLYDESLIRNQDDEFCFRLKRNGGKIYISPLAKSIYYVRDSLGKLFRQYYQYGFYRIAVIKKHKLNISFRHLVPSFFVLSLGLFGILSVIFSNVFIFILIPLSYLLTLIIASIPIIFRNNVKIAFYFIVAVVALHFSYGFGFLKGIFFFLIPKVKN